MGDRVLQAVASVLTSGMSRSADLVARHGGEEFALLMPDTDVGDAVVLAECLREATGKLNLPRADGDETGRITVSIGGATLQPGTGESAADLLKAADDHLYRAKKAGRNRVVWRGVDSMKS
jgi:diguanylate cyclase (GGDEF)-like protein